MTAENDLLDAMIERLTYALGEEAKEQSAHIEADGGVCVAYDGTLSVRNVALSVLSLLARWECKEPGDCPE